MDWEGERVPKIDVKNEVEKMKENERQDRPREGLESDMHNSPPGLFELFIPMTSKDAKALSGTHHVQRR